MRNDLKPTAAASQLNPHQPMSGVLEQSAAAATAAAGRASGQASGRAKQPTFDQLSVLFSMKAQAGRPPEEGGQAGENQKCRPNLFVNCGWSVMIVTT